MVYESRGSSESVLSATSRGIVVKGSYLLRVAG